MFRVVSVPPALSFQCLRMIILAALFFQAGPAGAAVSWGGLPWGWGGATAGRISLGMNGNKAWDRPSQRKEVSRRNRAASSAKEIPAGLAEELRGQGLNVEQEGNALKVSLSGGDVLKFAPGSAQLDENAKNALRGIAAAVLKYPARDMRIEGYTDNRGAERANIELSSFRAEVVRRQLVEFGVNENRIVSVKGYGPADPVADNSSDQGRRANRRVELILE
jgi:outer membrane protein OmpA-like peptidoglycan-associated protein